MNSGISLKSQKYNVIIGLTKDFVYLIIHLFIFLLFSKTESGSIAGLGLLVILLPQPHQPSHWLTKQL